MVLEFSVHHWLDGSRLRVAEGNSGLFESTDHGTDSQSGVDGLSRTVQTVDCMMSVGSVLWKTEYNDVEQHWSLDFADADWSMSEVNDCCLGLYVKQDLAQSDHCSTEVTGEDTDFGGCSGVVAAKYYTDTAPDYFSQCD